MGALRVLALVTSAAVLALSVYLYSPAPEGVEDPRLVQAYVAALRVADLVAYVLHTVTGVSTVSAVRTQYEMVYAPVISPSDTLQVETVNMEGKVVRIYRPQGTESKQMMPCVIYFHGGGWTFFSIDSYETVARKLSESAGVVVVSFEYRLAPENPYPIPFQECTRVARYVLNHGAQYKIDPKRVAVAGDGTGGNLAAAVALRLSEEDPSFIAPLRLQILIQPVLQVLTFNTPSYRENAYYSLIDRATMIRFWCHYLGIKPTASVVASMEHGRHISPSTRRLLYALYMSEAENVDRLYSKGEPAADIQRGSATPSSVNPDLSEMGHDPGFSAVEAHAQDQFVAPVMADDVSKLSPALVLVGDRDIVRDDGLVYAHKLTQAGVNVTVRRLPAVGQGHLAPLLPPSYWPASLSFSSSYSSWEMVYSFVNEHL